MRGLKYKLYIIIKLLLYEWYNGMILFGYYGVVFWKMWVIVMESLIEGIFFNRGVFYIGKIKE